jgi:hypothetical protein
MPRTRSQATRVDPAQRPVSGWFGELELGNQRPDRRYFLCDKGGGQGRELINPQSMMAIGWELERWNSVEAGKGWGGYETIYKPAHGALCFKSGGALVGPPGTVIEHSGAVLMSIDLETWRENKRRGQEHADSRERAIRTNEMQALETRALLKRAGVNPTYAFATPMDENDIARVPAGEEG